MRTWAARPGFAVATAVFALVVVGALAVGTLFAATRELRSGTDTVHQARAIMAAELGVERTIATWNRRWNGALGRGFATTSTVSTPEGARVTVQVTRVADELFLITSDARAGPARRRIARVVRLEIEEPALLAPFAARTAVSADSAIDGSDQSPLGWDCPSAGAPLPSVVLTDTSTLLRFGHFDWNELVTVASAQLSQRITGPAPRSTDEECDTDAPANWGEPVRSNGGACVSHYPVLHAPGNLVVDGGRGQGLLLVDGDLTLQGDFQFVGALLVRGALRGGPGGARVTGAVSIATLGAAESDVGGVVVTLSRCAARKALLGLAVPVPVGERSWYEGFEPQ